jgi:hypothetical protein
MFTFIESCANTPPLTGYSIQNGCWLPMGNQPKINLRLKVIKKQ